MDRFNRKMDVPLCQFGPGGDFTSQYDSEKPASPAADGISPLGKVLNLIAEVIGATVQPEILTEIACALPPFDLQNGANSIMSSEESCPDDQTALVGKYANQPQTTSSLKTNRPLAGQPMLFSNDWRIGPGAQHKPGHRLRTHRRTARKKAADAVHRQGSLFETNGCRRKTA